MPRMTISLILLLVLAFAPSLEGEQSNAGTQRPDLTELPLEALMEIEVPRVYGASKFEQKTTEAPSSVTVITSEEIKRFGYRTLARLAPRALRVGFAAETGIDATEAERKLAAKGAHLLVADDVSRPDIGFGSDDNEVALFPPQAPPIHLPKRSKRELAADLFDHFVRERSHVRPETEPVRP